MRSTGNVKRLAKHLSILTAALLAAGLLGSVASQTPARADTPTSNVLDWGFHYYGYLGDGSMGCSSCFVTSPPWYAPPGESYDTQISAETGIIALPADGSVSAWGRNDEGQLGDGGTAYDVLVPVRVILPPVVQISEGDDEFGLALTPNGEVYSWGNNTYGDLGRSSYGSIDPTPELVSADPSNFVSIAAGGDHGLALTSDGYVWAWGRNFAGQLGDPTKLGSVYQTPFEVPSLSNVVAIAADGNDSYALTSDGKVWAWGFDYGGQGHGPSQVTGLPTIKSIAAGVNQGLAIDTSGNVWAWGSNQYGQVGNGGSTGWQSPSELSGLSNVTFISGTQDSSYAVERNGTAYAWGGNWFGQLGDGTQAQRNTPVQVTGVSNVTGIVSSSFATFAWSGLQSATTPIGNGHMVILGDSVAAGEGVNYGFYWNGSGWTQSGPANPTWNDTTTALGENYQQCHQSNAAYGNYFQEFKGYTVYNMACTGATVLSEENQNGDYTSGGVMRYEQLADGSTVPAQLGTGFAPVCTGCDAVTPPTEFDNHNPNVVILTVGADDIDFGDWMSKCYSVNLGCGNASDTAELDTELSNEATDLGTVLTELNNRAALDLPAGQKVTVVVTDYYNPYGTTYNQNCVDSGNTLLNPVGITPAEQTWIVKGLQDLNSNIQQEAQVAENNDTNLTVKFVDLSGNTTGKNFGGTDVLNGHDFCSTDPWVYGPSIDYPNWEGVIPAIPDYPAPMHPTPEGQLAIYKAIVQLAGI